MIYKGSQYFFFVLILRAIPEAKGLRHLASCPVMRTQKAPMTRSRRPDDILVKAGGHNLRDDDTTQWRDVEVMASHNVSRRVLRRS